VAYCEEDDLLLGNIPIASYVSKAQYINDASDEIDSYIGFVYKTPVTFTSPDDPASRPARLLLKRINAHLASGRLIMALDAGGQDDRLHAYGYSLVKEAVASLLGIADGTIVLEGAEPVTERPDSTDPKGIVVHNIDAESNVEAFYDRVANPFFVPGLYGESFLR
jgi:hypothetical protein